MMVVRSTQWLLSLQRMLSYILLFFLYPCLFVIVYVIYRYRIVELKSVRQEFKKICSHINGPLLICSNHLTFIDPIMLIWAFGSFWYYLFHYNRFIWNFPNHRYSQKYRMYKLFFYISKCIPIHRNVYNRSIKHTFKKMLYLLFCKETLLIFPEGKRSLTGKINHKKFMKGVGRLLNEIDSLPVLCVYLRGESNLNHGFPARKEKFHLMFKLIYPKTDNKGLQAIEAYSTQIKHTLCSLEETWLMRKF